MESPNMAAGILQKPGSKYGPCDAKGSCEHLDCRATVREAHSLCAFCQKPIGYGVAFYQNKDNTKYFNGRPGWPVPALTDTAGAAYVLEHALCADVDAERRAAL